MVTEDSIAKSFANVKKDMMKIQANILEISGKQAEFFEMLNNLKNSLETKKPIKKKR
ncbi:MAG: hypothetical protein Q7S06_03965 [Nanoarchaeota archaeon]|nr:hypothetical protein [Nanoarchaeota archaeon]